jgi:hypothetical protein
MAIATGVNKQVKYKVEATYGTIPAAGSSQALRRVTSDIDLSKETYESNEIRTDYQIADFRHGVKSIGGTINGELSPATYKDFFAAALRQAWQTQVTTGAIITVTSAVTTGASGTFTRASGSYFTDGFKIGQVVQWSGFATTGVPNNAHNFMITALTALIMTGTMLDGVAVGAKVAGDSVTCVTMGKFASVPLTGHTDLSYSIEHYFSDLVLSEVFSGCKVSQIAVQLPATGMATVGIGFMGQNITTAGAEYFTSPTAETTSGILAAVNGAIYVDGTAVGNVTGMNFTINGNMTSNSVIGSNIHADIFEGRVQVSGQITAFFESATLRDLFINETKASINCVFTTANTAAADFIAFSFPSVKLGGAKKDDGDKGLIQTLPFTALLNGTGGTATTLSTLKTTLTIQDSQA